MSKDEETPFDVTATIDFQQDLKALAKRYRNIKRDISPTLAQISAGELVGERLQGIESNSVYKVRIANRDAQRGKSGGYRLIYFLKLKNDIYLLKIYSKSDTEDIETSQILAIVNRVIAEYTTHEDE